MIRLSFTSDSKRRGDVVHVPTLAHVASEVRGDATLAPVAMYGYPEAWEVTCRDTVIAYAMRLPDGAGPDYFPRYPDAL